MDKNFVEKMQSVARLDCRKEENKNKLDNKFNKLPFIIKMQENNKNTESIDILLDFILKNKKKNNIGISYIFMHDYLSCTVMEHNNFLCIVYGGTILEILKKVCIILYMYKKEHSNV
jgi:hypothetical protein